MTQIQIIEEKSVILDNRTDDPFVVAVTLFDGLRRPVKVRVQLSDVGVVLMPSYDNVTINPIVLAIKSGKLVVSASSLEDGVAYREETIEIIDIPEDEIPF